MSAPPEWTPCETVRSPSDGELERLREIERHAICLVTASESKNLRRMTEALTGLQDVFVRFLSERKPRVSCAEMPLCPKCGTDKTVIRWTDNKGGWFYVCSAALSARGCGLSFGPVEEVAADGKDPR